LGFRRNIAVSLLIVWAIIIVYNISAYRRAPREAELRGKEERAALPEVSRKRHLPYPGVKRDIFSPLASPLPARPLPAPVITPIAPVTPLASFVMGVRFMGFLEKEEGKTVFLRRGDDVYFVTQGDILEGRFLVAEITEERLKLRDGEEEAVVPLKVP
jgi:hypothetical protein